MDALNKRIYDWLPWLLALVVAGLFFLLLQSEWNTQDQAWLKQMDVQRLAMQQAISASEHATRHQSSLLAQAIAQDSQVQKLVHAAQAAHQAEGGNGGGAQSAAIRAELENYLRGNWAVFSANDVRELNVHLGAAATVFLRMGRPDRFGDDLTSISPALVRALKNREMVSAVEVGRYGTAFRTIAPLPLLKAESSESAAVEVALNPLPVPDADELTGYAVLLNTAFASDTLWGNVRQEVLGAAKGKLTPWVLEFTTDDLPKQLQQEGFFNTINPAQTAPWILTYQGRTYLLMLSSLADGPASPSLKLLPKSLLLSWTDMTDAYALYQDAHRESFGFKIIECVISFLVLLLLFRANKRHLMVTVQQHNDQLKQERDLSEQARQRLTLALVSSESGFWEWDIAHNKALFSREWREMCGLPGDGRADIEEWLERVHPSDKRTSYNDMIRHIKGETPMFENEYRLKVADGSYKWIFTRGKVVEWMPDGKAALMLGVYTDITERKLSEIIVARQQAALAALNEIASISAINAEEQLRHALIIGSRFLGAPNAVLSKITGNRYEIKIHIGSNSSAAEKVDALSNHFCEITLRNRDVFCGDNMEQSDYANHYAFSKSRIQSYIGIPVYLRNDLYGTLSFQSERARHQAYEDIDKDFMRLLARWISIALERWERQADQQELIDRFDKLCNQLPGFLYQFQLNPDGTSCFPFSSSGIQQIYGVRPDEVKESAEKVFAVLHPDEIGWISEGISLSAATLKNWQAIYRVRHPKLGTIWVRGEARPERLENGGTLWHGYIQNVNDEKLAAIKLQEINSLREAIFDAASVSIISTDRNGLIKTFNRGAENLLGYSAAETIDLMTPAPFHLADEVVERAQQLTQEHGREILPGFDVFVINAKAGEVEEREWTYVCKDGHQVPVILSVSALRNSDGEITGYLGIARDISELKRMDRMKSEFISTVSHELRTPLTAISGALGIIVNGAVGQLPATASKMLNIAHKNSQRLIHIVNDLLDMEKLLAGKMNFDMSMQPLLPIIKQSLDANAAYAAQYNVKFELNNSADDKARVNVDAQRLQQVLANFMSNAAKFSPENETVEIQINKVFNNIRVSVNDKGQGIPEEFRSRIFQKFSQADSSDSRQKGGTGLGLAICKEIIERMGGKIGFTSELGNGSQFYFEIPTEESFAMQSLQGEQRDPTGERILVVEDDPEMAELLATILRSSNYRVDIAYSGQSALERLALYTYQAMTVDIELPDIDGIQLIKQLRNDSITHAMPIIILSANLDVERLSNKKNSLFAGVQWLQKPQTPDAIIHAIKSVLAQHVVTDPL